MKTLANLFVGLVVIPLHVYFLVLEMFLWDTPFGRQKFHLEPAFATASKSLAANQGLYNGFLAAGLVWGLILGPSGTSIKIFFLSFVVIAGVFGGLRKREILLFQAVPGAVALALLLLS